MAIKIVETGKYFFFCMFARVVDHFDSILPLITSFMSSLVYLVNKSVCLPKKKKKNPQQRKFVELDCGITAKVSFLAQHELRI